MRTARPEVAAALAELLTPADESAAQRGRAGCSRGRFASGPSRLVGQLPAGLAGRIAPGHEERAANRAARKGGVRAYGECASPPASPAAACSSSPRRVEASRSSRSPRGRTRPPPSRGRARGVAGWCRARPLLVARTRSLSRLKWRQAAAPDLKPAARGPPPRHHAEDRARPRGPAPPGPWSYSSPRIALRFSSYSSALTRPSSSIDLRRRSRSAGSASVGADPDSCAAATGESAARRDRT